MLIDAQQQPGQLQAELAAFISQRTLGTVGLPPELVAAIEAVQSGDGTTSARALRRHGQHLLSELRNNSRSTARGGQLDLTADPFQSSATGRLSQKQVRSWFHFELKRMR